MSWIPTEDDDIVTERDGDAEALMVAWSPTGNLSMHPRGRILVSRGSKCKGDFNDKERGFDGLSEGMIAFECSLWNSAVCTNDVAADPST